VGQEVDANRKRRDVHHDLVAAVGIERNDLVCDVGEDGATRREAVVGNRELDHGVLDATMSVAMTFGRRYRR
jgi:hypothetical protein